ncbi:probable RNA methyltransferase CG11342 [Coccinella septempunctata]|uniref:probable RNA methyltransferase CG11342 n=1 Tax=Coccinella septempunctata TaxID=41139 RepID=UPI001D064FB4|nr:probable RNA methyltransferase CG11342 [Coccinella septempunctata]
MNETEDLKFKGNDPGAVRFGNFINYYSFYPPHERTERLPKNIWRTEGISYCLDIGCNTGDLTKALSNFLLNCGSNNEIIGIDIDPTLISRAKEHHETNLKFFCVDIMNCDGYNSIKTFLNDLNLKKFHIVTCFSISMWIHLNHGDIGLRIFLKRVSDLSELLVIEAQPWRCYRNAVKRMKKCNSTFSLFPYLQYRENIVKDIENILTEECQRIKITETEDTKWGRKTLFFR